MRTTPNFEVVGNVTDEEKEKVRNSIDNLFTNPRPIPDVDRINYPKTPAQISILKFVNEETNRLMQDVGAEPYDIPSDHYFIMDKKNFEKFFDVTEVSGTTPHISPRIGLVYEDTLSNLDFALISFHETLHAKAKTVWEAYKKENKIHIKIIRKGAIVNSRHDKDEKNKSHSYFSGLNEAIVEWQNKLVFPRILDLPELANEKKIINSDDFKIARRKMAKEKGIPEDRIIFIDSNNKPSTFVYHTLRSVLEYVCGEISKEFNTKYPNKENVLKEFLKVNFTCDHSTVITLVDTVFGKYAFRCLERLTAEKGSFASAQSVHSGLIKKRQEITFSTTAPKMLITRL